jgi:uncharacterized repeat protein (TIGR03803 family)
MKSRGSARLALILVLALSVPAAAKTKFRLLYNFTGSSDGGYPVLFAALARDSRGYLFGPAAGGTGRGCNPGPCGVAFEMHKDSAGRWHETVVFNFSDYGRYWPDGPFAVDSRGDLYGCTGNYGPMFELTPGAPHWNFNPIWSSGCIGAVGLILDSAGNLYGEFGNATTGGVSELSPTSNGWVYTNLFEFCQQLGCGDNPLAPFSWDSKGNLYGTTYDGGDPRCNNCGVAFQMTPNGDGTWTYHVLHRFINGNDGSRPYGSLTVDASGAAYGTTTYGGPYGNGNVFKLTPGKNGQWKLTVVYGFPNPYKQGFAPGNNLVFDKAGNLYGTAGSVVCGGACGLVFKLSPQKSGGWSYTMLHQFTGPDGNYPNGLTMDSQGNLYGTTQAGGKYGYGVVFEITP